MDLRELIAECRRASRDTVKPYFCDDDDWISYLNEAEEEACVRAFLIQDDESDFCFVDLEVGIVSYDLDPRILLVKEVRNSEGQLITGWDVIDETRFVLGVAPTEAQTVRLLCVRLPLNPMASDTDEPEIRRYLQRYLTEWALHRFYLRSDAETFNEGAATRHETNFERRFGRRPSANMQRKFRTTKPRVTRFNKAF